ncbi:MAG: 4Fe-4S dicluster domain-containing protein [Euryarchaeota archaeon]|nr:4Fe-4S dicluster domain-containing protein [Euryarchaeota archaeon]
MSEEDRCIRCGSCMRACPVVSTFGESVFPGPRSLAVDAPRTGKPMSMDELLKCSICMMCRDACPSRIDLPRSILALRAANRRGTLRPGHKRLVENIDSYGYSVRPDEGVHGPYPCKGPTTCLFPGCISRWRRPEILDDAAYVLRSNGTEVACPEDLVCCGSPLEKIGEHERRERLVDRNFPILEKFERVVTTCPGCAGQIVGYGIDAMHIVEYLYEVVGVEHLVSGLDGKGLKIAVHMPCHLNRDVGPHTKEYVHSILGAIPGLKVVEYPEEDRCCGAGGSLLSGFPEMAAALAKGKASAADRAGADLIVTSCPFCVVNLTNAGTMRTLDIVSLLRTASNR